VPQQADHGGDQRHVEGAAAPRAAEGKAPDPEGEHGPLEPFVADPRQDPVVAQRKTVPRRVVEQGARRMVQAGRVEGEQQAERRGGEA
jgi:hypothetical protein